MHDLEAAKENDCDETGSPDAGHDLSNSDVLRGNENSGPPKYDPNIVCTTCYEVAESRLMTIAKQVTWDGPDDPANPKNWSRKRRWVATSLVSLLTLMTPIASSMIAPSEAQIDHDLNITSSFVSKLVFSIFLLSFIIGPILLAPLSEVYGRVVILQLANIVSKHLSDFSLVHAHLTASVLPHL